MPPRTSWVAGRQVRPAAAVLPVGGEEMSFIGPLQNKKPRPERVRALANHRPFSELFNVAASRSAQITTEYQED
ncbi:hypothetical protein STAQ_12990 [Allostella sp. ATCC 35155]|nr:hypothetical protein STAQ_12990 [Stella sp. ATCC 35155]